MADRSIVVRLRAQVGEFKKGMDEAAKAAVGASAKIEGTGTASGKAGALVGAYSTQMAGLGLAVTAGVGVAVKKFADFDKQMSAVAATGQDARDNLDGLRDTAIQAGADTAYSATEAAAAVTELAKAGISANDVMGGALTGSLGLAASEGMDLAEAAGITATAMQQFGLKGSDAVHVADLLAAGAGKAMGSAADMGQALKQAGLVAANTGVSIEETTGVLAAFAQQGLIGSDAGTSLKTMLQRLANPAEDAAGAMDELGISAYDTNGSFVGLKALAGQLQTALGGMTDAQRDATLATIFGSDATRAATVLMKEGATGIAEWTDAVSEQGYAAQASATMMDNLAGDVEKLGGSLETLLITGGSGVNDVLRGVVQAADAVVGAIGQIPGPVLGVVTALAGAGGLGLVGVGVFGKISGAVSEGITKMADLGIISEKTAGQMSGSFGRVTKAAGLATVAVAAITAGVEVMTGATEVASLVAGSLADGWDTVNKTWQPQVVDRIIEQLHETSAGATGVSGVFRDASEGVGRFFGMFAGGGQRGVDSAIEALDALGVSAADFANAMVGTDAASARLRDGLDELYDKIISDNNAMGRYSDSTRELANALGVTLPEDIKLATGAAVNLRNWTKESSAAMDEARTIAEEQAAAQGTNADATTGLANAQGDLADATGETTGEIEDQNDALKDNVEWQREAAGIVLSVRDAQVGLEASIDDATEALKKNGRTLDITTEKGRANRSALDDVAESGWDLIESMRESGATAEQLSAQMGTNREAFIKAAEAFGMGKEEAAALADQLRLIPESFSLMVDANTDPAKGALSDVVTEIDEAEGTVTVNGDDGPVTDTVEAVTATINATTGSLTIAGKDGQALDVLFGVKRTVDATTGAVTITGKDAEGREKVYTFTSWANSQGASIHVTADTSAATRALNSIRNQFFGSNSFGVLKPTFAGGLVGLAGGGRVPGTPPANPFTDNLVASVDGGRSHIAIRSGEFVQSQPAVEHYGLAAMYAINSRRIPREVLAGYAGGGQVGSPSSERYAYARFDSARGPAQVSQQFEVTINVSGAGGDPRAIANEVAREVSSRVRQIGRGGVYAQR